MQEQKTTYDILGYCIYFPEGAVKREAYFWLRKFEEFLRASDNEVHKMLLEKGQSIDMATMQPNGEFLIRDGKDAYSVLGLARVTFLRENTSPIHIPAPQILKS